MYLKHYHLNIIVYHHIQVFNITKNHNILNYILLIKFKFKPNNNEDI